MDTISIGVDLHKHQFTCYYLLKNGGDFLKYQTDKNGYDKFKNDLRLLKEKNLLVKIAVESTGNTRYFKNEVEKEGFEVKVVNTMKFKVVNESVNKTDKKDAKTIAEFLDKDMLPEVKLCSEKSEQLRRLLTSRDILVKTKVKMKNQIHGLLLSFGIESKNGQLNSKIGRKAILDDVKDDVNKKIIELLVGNIDKLEEQIKEIRDELVKLTEKDRVVEILKSIPGTGEITAISVRAYIDDIKRFDNHSKLSSYCGLVPIVKSSDKSIYYGKITKRGPKELRTVLIQMVLGMIRCKTEVLNRFMISYRDLKKVKGSGKALVATARKFTKLIWTLLTKDEEFNQEKLKTLDEKQPGGNQFDEIPDAA